MVDGRRAGGRARRHRQPGGGRGMTAEYWWKSVTEASAPLTEQALRDTFAKIENERNTIAEERARRRLALSEWWKAQPEEVRQSEVGEAVYTIAASGQLIHPVVYDRLASAI